MKHCLYFVGRDCKCPSENEFTSSLLVPSMYIKRTYNFIKSHQNFAVHVGWIMSFLVATAKQKTGELFSHLLSKDGLGLEYPETNRFLSSYLRWGSCRGCHLAMQISSRGLSQSWDTAALEVSLKRAFCHVVNCLGDVSIFECIPPSFCNLLTLGLNFSLWRARPSPVIWGWNEKPKRRKKVTELNLWQRHLKSQEAWERQILNSLWQKSTGEQSSNEIKTKLWKSIAQLWNTNCSHYTISN